ncbi:membrane-associated proteins in eicosanoid and glutathione metabolism [Trametes gibbosa]|uniref:Glutathion S-transferase n=1 Tax=Trametes gibbosa TaxID=160864 RepID=A0A8T9EJN3_9APHY|nr:membrane-associated proteins in eicosanoid and glutathione metabolism [Trametes gibbosa]UNI95533.1 glutathion S-transferase [Trametes gibbosa]
MAATALAGIVLPKEFAYPAAAVVSTFYLLFWQSVRVGGARRRAGIEYPQIYAEQAQVAAKKEAQIFNCAQRAHQNTLESIPIVISSTLIAGLVHPVAAASLCGIWVLSRIPYTIGYGTGDPKKRNIWGTAYVGILSTFGLIGTATATAVSLIRAL